MKIFMISYGGGHCNILGAVYKELSKTPDNDITYAALTGAPLILKGIGVDFVTVSDLARRLPYYNEVKVLGHKYGISFHNDRLGIPMMDTISYYGIGMYDLIEEYGIEEAERQFEELNRKAFLPVESMRNLLLRLEPDVCVITSSPRMELATGIAADQLGIHVVRINDLPVCDPVAHRCSLCVMNEWAKNYAVHMAGVPRESVYVTGQPSFELDFSIEKEYVEEVKQRCGATRFLKTVTFFAENGTNQSRELDSLFGIARNMKDVLFVVKLHPNHPPDKYGDPRLKNVYITNLDAKPYFHFSDIVITTFSTTGMESALFGIPVIVINIDGRIYLPDYIEMGIAVLCDKRDELEIFIRTYLDKDSTEYIKLKNSQSNFRFVRNAVYNICHVIESSVVKAEK